MKLPAFFQVDLRKVPSQRERLIFLITFAVIFGALVKSCAVESLNITSNASQRLKSLQGELSRVSALPIKTESEKPKKLNPWVGQKNDLDKMVQHISHPLFRSEIKIIESAFKKPKNINGLLKMEINLVFHGSLQSTLDYLTYLQKKSAPLVIDSISVEHNADGLDLLETEIAGGAYANTN